MATAPSPLPLIDTDLQPLLDQFVGGVNTAIGNLNSDKASLAQQRDDAVANADALQQQLDEITADDTSLAAKLKDSLNQITGYQKQVAQLALPPTAYFGLEKNALFLADKKIPFQWIQPGNAGNTGGPQPGVAHGTCSWTPGAGPNGGTLAKISPAKAFVLYGAAGPWRRFTQNALGGRLLLPHAGRLERLTAVGIAARTHPLRIQVHRSMGLQPEGRVALLGRCAEVATVSEPFRFANHGCP